MTNAAILAMVTLLQGWEVDSYPDGIFASTEATVPAETTNPYGSVFRYMLVELFYTCTVEEEETIGLQFFAKRDLADAVAPAVWFHWDGIRLPSQEVTVHLPSAALTWRLHVQDEDFAEALHQLRASRFVRFSLLVTDRNELVTYDFDLNGSSRAIQMARRRCGLS